MADMKTLTLGGKTFNIMDAEARAKAIPTVQVGGDTLTWDGNTEGKVSAEGDFFGMSIYKISDIVPDADSLAGGALVYVGGGEEAMALTPDFSVEDVCSLATADGIPAAFVLSAGNVVSGEITFPEKGVYMLDFGAGEVILSIPGFSFAEKKIDPAYLYQPDWNQNDETAADFIKNRTHYKENKELISAENYNFISSDGMLMAVFQETVSLSVGATYTVVWDGTEYICPAYTFEGMAYIGNGALFGAMGADEPFLMLDASGQGMGFVVYDVEAMFTGISESTHSFTASGESIVKLGWEYLPNYNWKAAAGENGYIEGKPINTKIGKTIEWDGDVTGKTLVELKTYDDGRKKCLCRVADSLPWLFSTCIGYTKRNSINGVIVDPAPLRHGEGYFTIGGYFDANNIESIDVLQNDSTSPRTFIGATFPEAGIYFPCVLDANGNVTFYMAKVDFHMDEQLATGYIEKDSFFNSVETNRMYLRSSTTDSAKLFKITVDDSGTISATEVT